jgi:hypothetical protein
MKKNGTVLFVFFFLCARVYSFEENWISWGFEFGNSFETRPNSLSPLETYTGAFGLNVNQYAFLNNTAFGYFLHNSILYTDMTPVKNDPENFRGFQNESTLGAAFRFAITDRLKLLLNLGLNFMFLKSFSENISKKDSWSMESLNFGFSGGTALKYEIGGKNFFCSVGLRTTLHCLNRTSVLSRLTRDSRWSWNLLFGIKPYISFGLNLFSAGLHLGLPEKQAPAP